MMSVRLLVSCGGNGERDDRSARATPPGALGFSYTAFPTGRRDASRASAPRNQFVPVGRRRPGPPYDGGPSCQRVDVIERLELGQSHLRVCRAPSVVGRVVQLLPTAAATTAGRRPRQAWSRPSIAPPGPPRCATASNHSGAPCTSCATSSGRSRCPGVTATAWDSPSDLARAGRWTGRSVPAHSGIPRRGRWPEAYRDVEMWSRVVARSRSG